MKRLIKILTYKEVADKQPGSSTEPLVDVRKYDKSINAKYIKKDMLPITGEAIFVRDSIAKKLARIEHRLQSQGYGLLVVYGYRHPDIQQKYFNARKKTIIEERSNPTDQAIDEYVHNFVAEPNVAGHPAGAAVDITLIDSAGARVDMGTGIADYSDSQKIRTFAKSVTKEQAKNRTLLHDAMVTEGFAPFYGEWWHFSYGDREWAAFYDKQALFGPINFEV